MRKDDGLLDGASGTGREIDRRTIAKGVAWSVPVVIVATAAPAAAASGHITMTSLSGKVAGQSGNVQFKATFTNPGQATALAISISPNDGWSPQPVTVSVPAGTNQVSFSATRDKSSTRTTYTISYTSNNVFVSEPVTLT